MANGSTNIGLRPTQAVSTNFGDIMQRGLDNAARVRQEKRLDAQMAEKRRKDFEDKYGIDEELFVLGDTEFRTVNDATTEALSRYRDRYYDVYKQLEQNPNDLGLKKRLGNISNSVKKMKFAHEKMQTLGADYLEKLQEDKISGVDEDRWRDILEATDEGRLQINLDENDHMQFLFYDKQGALNEVIPYNELVRGTLIDRVDLDTELDQLVESMGGYKFDEDQGSYIRTEDIFGDKQSNFAQQWINAWVGTDEKSLETNDVLADLLNQATGGESKKRSNFTEEERQTVRDYLLDQIKGRYDEETSLKQKTRQGSGAGDEYEEQRAIIFPATNNGVPEVDTAGNFVFSLNEPRQLTASKSDVRIQSLKATPDGRLTLVGEDRQKIKGNPQSKEEAAQIANTVMEKIFEDKRDPNSVTYYVREPISITYRDGENNQESKRLINAFASQVGYRNEDGLRNAMYQSFVEQFGKEAADRYFGGDLTPQPKQDTEEERRKKAQELINKYSQNN